jgi:hypothetical protein
MKKKVLSIKGIEVSKVDVAVRRPRLAFFAVVERSESLIPLK